MMDRRVLVVFAVVGCARTPTSPHVVLRAVTPSDAGVLPSVQLADPFCDDMLKESKAVAARVKPKKIELGTLDFLQCAKGSKGGWAFRIDDAIVTTGDDDDETVGLDVVLVHRDERGRLTTKELPSDELKGDGGSFDASVRLVRAWGSRELTQLAIGDVDGDGDPEVFVSGGVFDEGQRDLWGAIYTFREGRIIEYAPAHGLDVMGFEDADKDGRFDVRTRGPYAVLTQMNAMPAENKAFSDPLFLAHAQPNGTFSLTDGAARADLKTRCASTQAIVKGFDENDAKLRIVCERAAGVTAAQVRSELTAACGKFVRVPMSPGECADVLLAIADVVPP